MITFTQIIHANTVCLLAANQAARLGAVLYGDRQITAESARHDVYAAAQGVVTHNLSGDDYAIQITTDGTDVTVSVTYNLNSPVPWWRLITGSGTITAKHTSTYRIEKQ